VSFEAVGEAQLAAHHARNLERGGERDAVQFDQLADALLVEPVLHARAKDRQRERVHTLEAEMCLCLRAEAAHRSFVEVLRYQGQIESAVVEISHAIWFTFVVLVVTQHLPHITARRHTD